METLFSIEELKQYIRKISWLLGTNKEYVEVSPFSDGMATPNVYIDKDGYHWHIGERGITIEHVVTTNISEILYRVACTIVSEQAGRYELQRRYSLLTRWFRKEELKQSTRRIWFKRELQLLRRVDPLYEERLRKELMETLERSPFDDGLPEDIDYENPNKSFFRRILG